MRLPTYLVALFAAAPAWSEPFALTCSEAGVPTEDQVLTILSDVEDETAPGPTVCIGGPALLGLDQWQRRPELRCALDGGWGLRDSEGGETRFLASLVGVEHDGDWLFARVGPSELIASASRGSRPPLALEVSGDTFWRVRIDLGSKRGSMWTIDGETELQCAGVWALLPPN